MYALDASLLFGTVFPQGLVYDVANRTLAAFREDLCTTEACLTEAMYLAGNRVGWRAQDQLWKTVDSSELQILSRNVALVQRLMRRYRDVPMDFADATLVALASEDLRVRIATFDSDFLAYRRDDGTPIPLVEDRLLGWE